MNSSTADGTRKTSYCGGTSGNGSAAGRRNDLKKLNGKPIHDHWGDFDGKVQGSAARARRVVKCAPYLQAIKELHIEG
jgi:hypothetical protein